MRTINRHVVIAVVSLLPFVALAQSGSSKPATYITKEEVETVNKTLTHVEAVKKFRILEKRLDRDDGELTPTLKVRRRAVEQRYKPLIDEMYAGG